MSETSSGRWTTDAKELARIKRSFKKAGIPVPMVPSHIPQLYVHTDWGSGFSSRDDVDFVDMYSFGGGSLAIPEGDLNSILFGHWGHGINSYGLGLIGKIGPLVVMQQTALWGGYMEERGADLAAYNQISAWNYLVGEVDLLSRYVLEMECPAAAMYAVVFSDFRNLCHFLVRDQTSAHADSHYTELGQLPRGWRVVGGDLAPRGVEIPPDIAIDVSSSSSPDANPWLELGLQHLRRLANGAAEAKNLNRFWPDKAPADF